MFYKKRYLKAQHKLDLLTNPYIVDVNNFNSWFCSDKPSDIYANKGIFLRLDKLSQHHIVDYIFSLTNDLTKEETEELYCSVNLFNNFEKLIRSDWNMKIAVKKKVEQYNKN